MVDVTTADVSARNILREPLYRGTFPGEANRKMMVLVEVEVDTDTRTDYPTGGIPLSSLFTKDDDNDTGLDPGQPIYQIGGLAPMRHDRATYTPQVLAQFYNGGTTAADQTLRLLLVNASSNDSGLAEHTNATMAGADGFGAADEHYVQLWLLGNLRPDVSFER